MSYIKQIAGVSFILPVKFIAGTSLSDPAYNISGYTFVLKVQAECKTRAALTLSSADGDISNGGASGIAYVTFSEAATANLAPGTYKQQIVGTKDGVENLACDLDDLMITRRLT